MSFFFLFFSFFCCAFAWQGISACQATRGHETNNPSNMHTSHTPRTKRTQSVSATKRGECMCGHGLGLAPLHKSMGANDTLRPCCANLGPDDSWKMTRARVWGCVQKIGWQHCKHTRRTTSSQQSCLCFSLAPTPTGTKSVRFAQCS